MFEKWKHRRNGSETNGEGPVTMLAIIASESARGQLQCIFQKAGWKLLFTESVQEAVDQPTPIVLLDRDVAGLDWRGAMVQLARWQSPRCVILASYVADDYLWEEVILYGGYDVLPKPFREDEVIHTVQFAWAALTKSLPSAPRTR